MVRLNLPGGGIFDTIIAQAALKAKADTILTLNPNHFTRLGKDIGERPRRKTTGLPHRWSKGKSAIGVI